MTDGPALLAAILADPGDDTARLVFADWLEENGQRKRAEFIRVQVEIARRAGQCGHVVRTTQTFCPACSDLRRREENLWLCEGPQGPLNMPWIPGLSRPLLHQYSRGFVSHVTCSWPDWSRHATAILERHPVTTVTLAGKVPYTVAENAGGGFGWFDDKYRNWDDGGYGTDPDSVPRALIEAMEKLGLGTGSNRERFFKTEAEALAALSDACIAWGREQIPRPLPDHLTARNT